MMKASDVMTTEHVWACAESADARSVAQMMSEHDVGLIPVLDPNGRLEGVVTDRDLCCRVLAKGRSMETPIKEIMTTKVETVHPDSSLQDIEQLMRSCKIRRLPVVDQENRLEGVISFSDLAHHCQSSSEEHELFTVFDTICRP